MYVVIFRARVHQLDAEYGATALRLRDLALTDFGCVEFISLTQEEEEITLSYWNSLEDIQRWKQHPDHRAAQQLGRDRWYQDYTLEVTEVLRTYGHQERAQC